MQVASDAVVFTVLNNELQVLLIKRRYPPFKGTYALPGGFLQQHESPEEAAIRELREETGVQKLHLHQLGAYGDPKRDPRGRVLSVSYIALADHHRKLHSTTDALRADWFLVHNLPKLAFDHAKIIEDALVHLRLEIQTTNIAYQILTRKFTLSQLQKLYELILEKKLDKRNFRKKIKELDLLEETKELFREGAHRPAMLYRFRDREYKPLSEKIQAFL
ncbi:MAG: NUDIX hydrolase [Nanoarchaeota archaeon]|nr:NUDIX hydrolase [Nanoarchaeota archaeon]